MKKPSIVFGLHSVESLLKKYPERIIELHILQERHDQKMLTFLSYAKRHHIQILFSTRAEMDELTDHANHQGIIALCRKTAAHSESELERLLETIDGPAFLVLLDGVQDPHNLGAILRSADAAGVHAVVAPKDKSVAITATVAKVASGAAETVPFFQVTNLVRTMEMLKEKNIWIFGAEAESPKTLYKMDFKSSVAIVLGGEGKGLRRLTAETCDALCHIPMKGSVASLNVSVAAGVFMFEVVRQRG